MAFFSLLRCNLKQFVQAVVGIFSLYLTIHWLLITSLSLALPFAKEHSMNSAMENHQNSISFRSASTSQRYISDLYERTSHKKVYYYKHAVHNNEQLNVKRH